MNIICLKLTTGEDLIARCADTVDPVWLMETGLHHREQEQIFELEDVHVINLQQVAPNQVGLTLIPYLLGDQKAKVKINAIHVITTYKPNSDIENGFITKTSNIQIAKSVPHTKIQL